MRRLVACLLVVTAGTAAPATALAAASTLPEPVPVPEPQDRARLLAGKILVRHFEHEDGLKGSSVRFWAKAPVDQAYSALADPAQLAEYMPNLHMVRVLGRQPDGIIVKMVSQIPFAPELTIKRWGNPETRTIRWVDVRTPFRRMEGRWHLSPLGEGTQLEYTLGIDATGNPVPSWIISGLQQQGTRQLADHVRRRVESGGTWKKSG
ncbi:MAG: SRPBCC family protein [Candidatus Sericytochromatia bacterium]|nr:SRPBCC family protein [Candidatus Sericytochromatia bacterium]